MDPGTQTFLMEGGSNILRYGNAILRLDLINAELQHVPRDSSSTVRAYLNDEGIDLAVSM